MFAQQAARGGRLTLRRGQNPSTIVRSWGCEEVHDHDRGAELARCPRSRTAAAPRRRRCNRDKVRDLHRDSSRGLARPRAIRRQDRLPPSLNERKEEAGVARVEIGGRRHGQEVWARWIDGHVQGDREFLRVAGPDPGTRFDDPHDFRIQARWYSSSSVGDCRIVSSDGDTREV
jgi:hypothetical protein